MALAWSSGIPARTPLFTSRHSMAGVTPVLSVLDRISAVCAARGKSLEIRVSTTNVLSTQVLRKKGGLNHSHAAQRMVRPSAAEALWVVTMPDEVNHRRRCRDTKQSLTLLFPTDGCSARLLCYGP